MNYFDNTQLLAIFSRFEGKKNFPRHYAERNPVLSFAKCEISTRKITVNNAHRRGESLGRRRPYVAHLDKEFYAHIIQQQRARDGQCIAEELYSLPHLYRAEGHITIEPEARKESNGGKTGTGGRDLPHG